MNNVSGSYILCSIAIGLILTVLPSYIYAICLWRCKC